MRRRHDQQLVDVICQHNKDGSMIPMRVRLTDEVGAIQTYTIKNYEDLSHQAHGLCRMACMSQTVPLYMNAGCRPLADTV